MARPPRDPDDDATYSKDGRVDPKQTVVTGKPRRRRRRNRPEPDKLLKDWQPGARKRINARPIPPDIILEPAGMDEEFWTSPHGDDKLWHAQLAEAFGTRSYSVIWTFMQQLEALCRKTHWDEAAKQWRISEHEFSAILAIINSLKPRNELEAAHAAQMVAIHLLSMKLAARALQYEWDLKTASTAAKMAQVFTNQRLAFEQIRKPNRTARQSIKVSRENHVHYHDHRPPRGAAESDRQPHDARAETIEGSAPMPGDEQGGKLLRLPSRSRPRRVS